MNAILAIRHRDTADEFFLAITDGADTVTHLSEPMECGTAYGLERTPGEGLDVTDFGALIAAGVLAALAPADPRRDGLRDRAFDFVFDHAASHTF